MQEENGVKVKVWLVGLGSRIMGAVLLAGLVLLSGQAWASVGVGVGSPPASTSAPNGGVEVKVDDSVTNAATTRGWVEERAARALGELERPLAPGDLVRITVGGGPFDYRISLLLLRRGGALAAEDQPDEIACGCGSDEMLEAVATAITAAARTLDGVAEREREAAAAADAQRRREEQEEQQRRAAELERQAEEREARHRASQLKHAGIGTFVAGGALTIGGIVMMRQPTQAMSRWQVNERDWSVPGRALLGIGVTAMAAGLTVVIVDAVRCRRNRSRCAAPATAWASERGRWAARSSGGAW